MEEQNAFERLTEKRPREEGPKSMHHGGSFRTYMAYKVQKLDEQFAQQSKDVEHSGQQKSNIFSGICIHVNGLTNPNHQELKQLMSLHGGVFANYYFKNTVTHVICDHLPDTKLKQLLKSRSATPIVRAAWIVESIAAGKLLPPSHFSVERLQKHHAQRTIATPQRGPAPAQLHSHDIFPNLQPNSDTPQAHAHADQTDGLATSETPPAPAAVGAATVAPAQTPEDSSTSASHAASRPGLGAYPPHTTAERPSDEQRTHPSAAAGGVAQSLRTGSMAALHRGKTSISQRQDPKRVQARPAAQARHVAMPTQQTRSHIFPSGLPAATQGAPHHGADGTGTTGSDAARHSHEHSGAEATPSVALAAGTRAEAPQCDAARARSETPNNDGPAALSSKHGSGRLPLPGAPVLVADTWTPDQIRQATRSAAQMRDACDVLKMAPRSTADDPNFMTTYFKSSRLHFIGTWKLRIEALMAERAKHAPQPAPLKPAGHFNTLFEGRKASNNAPAPVTERAIIHLDMDCFFASVSASTRPELHGIPLAVAHSNNAAGHSEISCVSYTARRAGVRADMWMHQAKQQCPDMVVIPYEFDAYQRVSEVVYKILLKYTARVSPLSCDEAYLDVTGLGDPEDIAYRIRKEVFAATGCTASAGAGPSLLIARMATKTAKPNGQRRIRSEEVAAFLCKQPVQALPGVGWAATSKLHALGVRTVADLRTTPKQRVDKELGPKTAEDLWNYAWGKDTREVEPPGPRKSVGAEVNYGIRFKIDDDAHRFVSELGGEVANRMALTHVRARSLTLKLKRRKDNAPEPPKFLGHGICDNVSRSVTLPSFIHAAPDIAAHAWDLFRGLAVPADQVRGVGIVMSRLDTFPASAQASPSAASPGKAAAPPRTTWDPSKPGRYGAWVPWIQEKHTNAKAYDMAEPQRGGTDPPRGVGGDRAAPGARDRSTVAQADTNAAAAAAVAGTSSESRHDAPGHGTEAGAPAANAAASGAQRSTTVTGAKGAPHSTPDIGVTPDPREHQELVTATEAGPARETEDKGRPESGVQERAQRQASELPEVVPPAAAPAEPPRHTGPITALPNIDTLDMSVVDDLPPAIRIELMRAYGLAPAPRPDSATRRGGRRRPLFANATARATPKRPPRSAAQTPSRTSQIAAGTPGTAAKSGARSASATPLRNRVGARTALYGGITISQLDPEVLKELPEDVRRALLEELPHSRETFLRSAELDGGTDPVGVSLVHDAPEGPTFSGSSPRLPLGEAAAVSNVHEYEPALQRALRCAEEGDAVRLAVTDRTALDATAALFASAIEHEVSRASTHEASCTSAAPASPDDPQSGRSPARCAAAACLAAIDLPPASQAVTNKTAALEQASGSVVDGEAVKAESASERLEALLQLLAAWHLQCLRLQRWLVVERGCQQLLHLADGKACDSARLLLRRYVSELQCACSRLYGWRLALSTI